MSFTFVPPQPGSSVAPQPDPYSIEGDAEMTAVVGEIVGRLDSGMRIHYMIPPPPAVRGTNTTNVPVPETWMYRKDWRRVFLFRLVGMEPARGEFLISGEDAFYECQMPRAPGQICGEIVRDRLCTGKDLESHAASVHGVEAYPEQFRKPFKQWSSGFCDCAEDVSSCFDCLFCPFCFIARLHKVTDVRYERKVMPYVTAFAGEATGCPDGTCGSCIVNVLVQPWLWCLWPCGIAGFCNGESERFCCCLDVFPPIGRTKTLQGIDESDFATKCKTFWCCPLALCQTYRELRQIGINPGLTCCDREPWDPFTVEAARLYHSRGHPKMEDILDANGGGFPRTIYGRSVWSNAHIAATPMTPQGAPAWSSEPHMT